MAHDDSSDLASASALPLPSGSALAAAPGRAARAADAAVATGLPWSDEVRLLRRPFAAYRDLAERHEDARAWHVALRGPLLWLTVVAGFVSLTSAGRLVWYHLLFPAVAWSFAPLFQALWVALVSRGAPRALPLGRRLDLYFRGQAPWYLWMLFIAGLCLFTPHARLAFEALTPVVVVTLLATFVASGLLTYAYFRAALGFSRWAATARTGAFYLLYGGGGVVYFLATDQLIPLLTR